MTKKNRTAGVFSFLLLVIATGCALGQVSPQESLKSLKPAEGLEVSLWAHEPMVNNPTAMDIDSRGRVWISEGLNYRLWSAPDGPFKRAPGADRVKILEDTDGDGRADKVTVFADNIFPPPMGLAVEEVWEKGKYRGVRVYVGNSPNLLVLEDTDGDDRADRRYPLLTGYGGLDSDHGLHGMVLGPDGKLYFTQGDARYGKDKIQGAEATFDVVDKSGRRLSANRYGTTQRVNLDGTQLEVLGYRQRNNYETSISSFGHVFTSDNDDDGERGCRMIWMMDGGDYGYQTPRSNRHSAEELPGVIPKLVGTGNGAPTGILVYEGNIFAEDFRGAVIQLDAGAHQVNLHPLTRYGAGFRSEHRVLLSSEDSWFRPVDAAAAPDGALFVSDWYDAGVGGNRFSDQDTGRIYRLKPAALELAAPKPDFAAPAGLLEALKSPNIATRFVARSGLLQEGRGARVGLTSLLRNGSDHEQARALFVLAALPETGRSDVLSVFSHANPRMRELALRILARDLKRESVVGPESARLAAPDAVVHWDAVAPLADDSDPGVRRELIMALRNVGTAKAGELLTKLALAWDGRDRYYLEALHAALHNREATFLQALFEALGQRAKESGWGDEPVALPPYYPTTTNDAFLHTDDELAPANAASKLVGLAWSLRRTESLPSLRMILRQGESPGVVQGADLALLGIADPLAAEVLMDSFLSADNAQRKQEVLALLGPKLAGAWMSVRDGDKMRRVLGEAIGGDGLKVQAITTIARSGAAGYNDRLVELASGDEQEISTRAAALAALGKLKEEAVREMASQLVERAKGQTRGGPLALAALSALNDLGGAGRENLFSAVLSDSQYPLDFRRRALQLISATHDGARRLLATHRENQLAEDLKGEVVFLLHNHADRQIRRTARAEILLPQTASGKRIQDLNEVLALRGNSQRGSRLFHRVGDNSCASCHRVQGVGSWVGPDLSSIGAKYGKRELLYHILNPSGAINYNYAYYSFALSDGRVLSGLIADESAGRVVLKTAQGQRIDIAKNEIETRRALNISIMPDNLVSTMTEQDLADLISYLAILRLPVSSVGQYFMLGPLDESTSGVSSKMDLRKTWPGAGGGSARWRRVSTSRDNQLDLSSLLGSNPGKAIYCLTPLTASRSQDARLVLMSPNRLMVWLNGRPIQLSRPHGDPPASLWQCSLKLKSGTNRLLIRVASGQVGSSLVSTIVTDRVVRFNFDEAQP